MKIRERIFNLLTINERYLEKHKDVYISFIDYEKALDRVKHGKLCDALGPGQTTRFFTRFFTRQKIEEKIEPFGHLVE